jgi:hypothetical protein
MRIVAAITDPAVITGILVHRTLTCAHTPEGACMRMGRVDGAPEQRSS